ncbi:MAG TPA: transglycosylase SLT domain-containing protein [Paenirhodobacter sp.]
MLSIWRPIATLILALLPGAFMAVAIPLRAEARATGEMVASVCERAAEEAARRSGVPVSVLKAISLTETGRKAEGGFRPWPWTVNMEGAGHWFDTLAEARAYVQGEHARGAQSFDVGCFQINYRWHGEAFSSIDQMFEPLPNALYAARFLSELYAETGNWNDAAGAYHSRTKSFADKYAARFAQIRQNFIAEDRGLGPITVAQNRVVGGNGQDGAPLSAISSLTFDDPVAVRSGQTGDIPEIPDIVAMLNPAEAATRTPKVNNYPLLQRQAEVRPPSGTVPRASLFIDMEGVDDTAAPTSAAPVSTAPAASLFSKTGGAAGVAPGSLMRVASDKPPEGKE